MIRMILCLIWLQSFGAFFCQAAEAVEYKGENLRDPFSSGDKPVAESALEISPADFKRPELILNGIIWVPGKPRAILNGKHVLTEGMIEGAKVIEIRKNEVKMKFNGQEWTLKPEGKGNR